MLGHFFGGPPMARFFTGLWTVLIAFVFGADLVGIFLAATGGVTCFGSGFGAILSCVNQRGRFHPRRHAALTAKNESGGCFTAPADLD